MKKVFTILFFALIIAGCEKKSIVHAVYTPGRVWGDTIYYLEKIKTLDAVIIDPNDLFGEYYSKPVQTVWYVGADSIIRCEWQVPTKIGLSFVGQHVTSSNVSPTIIEYEEEGGPICTSVALNVNGIYLVPKEIDEIKKTLRFIEKAEKKFQ